MDVVSCFEEDVFGMYYAAFDCHVFFGDDSGCSSYGDGASFGFLGGGFSVVFPSGAAQADIDSYGIVLINGFVCLLVFCMSLAFIPACRAYRAFSRPSPTSPALFTGAATVLAALTAAPPKDTVRPLFLYSCSSFPL